MTTDAAAKATISITIDLIISYRATRDSQRSTYVDATSLDGVVAYDPIVGDRATVDGHLTLDKDTRSGLITIVAVLAISDVQVPIANGRVVERQVALLPHSHDPEVRRVVAALNRRTIAIERNRRANPRQADGADQRIGHEGTIQRLSLIHIYY